MSSKQQAAQEASLQYLAVLSTPLFGIMDTVSTLVSRTVGTGNYRNAKKLGYTGIGLGVFIAAIGLVFFISIPNLLLEAFIDSSNQEHTEIMTIGRSLLWINGVGQIADSIRNIAAGGLSGFYDVLIPTVLITLTLIFIFFPLSYVMGFPLNLDAIGVMAARDITIGLGAILLFWRWVKTDKQAPTSASCNEPKIEEIHSEDNATISSDIESVPPMIGSNNSDSHEEQMPLFTRHSKASSTSSWASYFHTQPVDRELSVAKINPSTRCLVM